MSDAADFSVPGQGQFEETTGRYVVTFREDAVAEGLKVLRHEAGVAMLPSAVEFAESALDIEVFEAAGGAVFPSLGVAVVTLDDGALGKLMAASGDEPAILGVEPERIFYAIAEPSPLSLSYLKGYRDSVNHLYMTAAAGEAIAQEEVQAGYVDDARSTWGLKATNAINSRFTGRGVKVAILDTGFDLLHPDFKGRAIVSRSFIAGQPVQDGHGHGTHCTGTACGTKDASGRRYGVATDSSIYIGKVLSNGGSGTTSGILAGMEWAIQSGCAVVSMSLGNTVTVPSTAYENAGRRALQRGCLVVAAAGNHHPGILGVGQPANSPSIMAVAALDNQLRKASFSAVSGTALGGNVDIAGPGVAVYSSTKMPQRYATWNGTSMATPHVAGAAALWAQAHGASGWQLWALLTAFSRRLPLASMEAGSGLVLAPM